MPFKVKVLAPLCGDGGEWKPGEIYTAETEDEAIRMVLCSVAEELDPLPKLKKLSKDERQQIRNGRVHTVKTIKDDLLGTRTGVCCGEIKCITAPGPEPERPAGYLPPMEQLPLPPGRQRPRD